MELFDVIEKVHSFVKGMDELSAAKVFLYMIYFFCSLIVLFVFSFSYNVVTRLSNLLTDKLFERSGKKGKGRSKSSKRKK